MFPTRSLYKKALFNYANTLQRQQSVSDSVPSGGLMGRNRPPQTSNTNEDVVSGMFNRLYERRMDMRLDRIERGQDDA